MTFSQKTRTLLTGLIFVGLLVGGTVPISAGSPTSNSVTTQAGDVTVELTPSDQTIDAGTTTEYDLVVSGATDGIDAYEIDIALTNGTVGTIDSFSFEREPGVGNANITSSGTKLSVEDARLGDPIGGNNTITLGTINIAGNSQGDSAININSAEIAIGGDRYTITELASGNLTVTGNINNPEISLTVDNGSIQTGEEATLSVNADDITNGVSTLNFTIAPTDPGVVEYGTTTVQGDDNATIIQLDSGELRVEAEPTRENGDIQLATTDLVGAQTGEANITLSDVQISDQDGDEYTPRSITGTALTVTDGSGVAIALQSADSEISVNGQTTIDVVVQDAANGISAFTTNISVTTPETATITDFEYTQDPQFPDSKITSDSSTLVLSAAMGGNVYDAASEHTVATVTVRGDAPAQAQVKVGGDTRVDDVDGVTYEVSSLSGTSFNVTTGPPPIAGDMGPQDADGDGTYEDIDGDGSLNIFDVQALFDNLDAEEVQNNPQAFNFDGAENPDSVTIFDVQSLLQQVRAQG